MPTPLPSRLRSARAMLRFLVLVLTACSRPPVHPASEGTVPLAGGDALFFRAIGGGPDTVVFLHGGPALSSRYLEEGFGELGRQHTLIFYDQRGRGRSPAAAVADSLRIETDVADLEALRVRFGLSRLTLVAHQYGAAIALKYALREPDRVGRLVLVAPFPHRGNFVFELTRLPRDTAVLARHLRVREARMDTTDPTGYCRQYWGMAFAPIEITDPAVIRRLAPAICDAPPDRLVAREGIQRQIFRAFGTWDWVDSIPRLAPPTLVVVGGGSEPLVIGARAWAGRLPEGRLLVTGRTPLFPWLEAGESVVQGVAAFLGGEWPRAAVVVESPPDRVTSS